MAEKFDLTVVEMLDKTNHAFLVLKNSNGDQMLFPMHKGKTPSARAMNNSKARLKRFANGRT